MATKAMVNAGATGRTGLTMPASTILARLASGEIVAATVSQLNTLLGKTLFKSYNMTSRGLGAGTFWTAGYYDAPAASVALNHLGATKTFGTANSAYGAHAFIVAGGPGSLPSGVVGLRVKGTSITDAGVRTATDTEVLTADFTTLSTNDYLETTKKWIGQVTFELYVVSGTPSAYQLFLNYGFAKYEDFGNRDITITDFEVVGLAGATDSNFDIVLYKHSNAGWTYHATAFAPGGTVICKMSTDYVTEKNLTNNKNFAYKRASLSTFIAGASVEGVVAKIVTSQTNSVQIASIHIGGSL